MSILRGGDDVELRGTTIHRHYMSELDRVARDIYEGVPFWDMGSAIYSDWLYSGHMECLQQRIEHAPREWRDSHESML
jgi:hypothetical protein